MTGTAASSTESHRDIKLPAFSDDIRQWLTLSEAVLSYIAPPASDEEKFVALLKAIPIHLVEAVDTVITDPPRTNKFKALKNALEATVKHVSDEETFAQLTTMLLGDSSPSELLKKMKSINRRRTVPLPDQLIRSLHLQKMPVSLQALIEIAGTGKNDDGYAEAADKVLLRHNLKNYQPSTYNVTPVSPTTATDVNTVSEVTELKKQIKKLQQQLQASQRQSESDLCYYHQRFGREARNCRPPCSFQGNWRAGGR